MTRIEKELEDTKGVIRIRKPKDIQHNGQKKKGQTTIYKTLHRKIKRRLSCNSSYKPGDKSWMRKGLGAAYDK
jgi:hypothetical protein